MKEPCFFVQNNMVEQLTVPVARFAHERGITLHDRSSTATFDPDACGIDWSLYDPVLPYGSVQFLRHLRGSEQLSGYVLHDEPSFSASVWAEHLGDRLLNGAGQVLSADEVRQRLANGPAHVRPNSQDKAFNATAFDAATWDFVVQDRGVSPELSCWYSPLQSIETEWRCWLVGGRLVEASQYRSGGSRALERGAPPEVAAFVEDISQTWLPAPCVVMDIARTPEGLKVIEFNPIHCSGWYAADAGTILASWLTWSVREREVAVDEAAGAPTLPRPA